MKRLFLVSSQNGLAKPFESFQEANEVFGTMISNQKKQFADNPTFCCGFKGDKNVYNPEDIKIFWSCCTVQTKKGPRKVQESFTIQVISIPE